MRAHEGVDDAAAAAVGGYGRHRGHEVPVPVDAAKFDDCEGRVNKTRKRRMGGCAMSSTFFWARAPALGSQHFRKT